MGLNTKFLILTLGYLPASFSIAETLSKPFLFSKQAIFQDESRAPFVKTLDEIFEKKLRQWRKWENYDLIFAQDRTERISIPIALFEFREGFFENRNNFQYNKEIFEFESKKSSDFLVIDKLQKTFFLQMTDQSNNELKIWLADFSSSLTSPPKNSSNEVKLGYFFAQNPTSPIFSLFSTEELQKFKASYYAFMTDLNRLSFLSH